MKIPPFLLLAALLATATHLPASEEMEKEFKERFRAFIEAGDVSRQALETVWLYEDTPTREFIRSQGKFESTIARGLETIEIVDIYPQMREGLDDPVQLEGATYVINLEPYGMLEATYRQEIEGGSDGWSYVLGKKDGKLYLVGLTERDPIEETLPE